MFAPAKVADPFDSTLNVWIRMQSSSIAGFEALYLKIFAAVNVPSVTFEMVTFDYPR